MNAHAKLRLLPAVEKVLQHERLAPLAGRLAPEILTVCVRRAVAELRSTWLKVPPAFMDEDQALQAAVQLALAQVDQLFTPSLKRVINGTGVILHTGLGRALLSAAARQALEEVLPGYCNLELDLITGRRGDRHLHVERLLCDLTGAEAACVVNNNAAAVLLVLNTIANRKEIITSRGQLVEIGGSFRMPEVVKKSGARLVEVGTTNKTKLADYAGALRPRTAGILVVHSSNFRILGFTHEVALKDVARLARAHGVVVVHDLGGGVLVDLRRWGLPYEPLVSESVQAGAHIVTFSGDKVLGGPQCGLIVGEAALVSKVKKNPLMRALRCDKLTLALLEGTLRLFLNPASLAGRHEVFRMLVEPAAAVQQRAQLLQGLLQDACGESLEVTVAPAESEVGSGAMPLERIASHAICLRSRVMKVNELSTRLRCAAIPVLGYVREERLWLDARTLLVHDLPEVARMIAGVVAPKNA